MTPSRLIYFVLLGLDLAAAAVISYFFFIGIADGSVSDFNSDIWTILLLGVAAVVGVGVLLYKNARPILANLVLAILGVPAFLYGFFILVVFFSGASWN